MFADIQSNAGVVPWFVDGQTQVNEDTWIQNEQFLVSVDVRADDGSLVSLFHTHAFLNDPEGAQRLADRVNECGVITLKYWGHHGYLSLSLEERMHEEWVAEEHARQGMSHLYNGPAAGGHE